MENTGHTRRSGTGGYIARGLLWLLPLALILTSCEKLRNWIESLGEEYYAEWATSCFLGNDGPGRVSTFTLDIRQGNTYDEQTLNSGTEIFLTLTGPAVTDCWIPSGEYVVSETADEPFTIRKHLGGQPVYSFIEFFDGDDGKPRRYPVEDGKVRIDRHENAYGIKVRVTAGGSSFSYDYNGEVLAADATGTLNQAN